MMGETRTISIEDIVNYSENPRHAIAMNEKDTLKKLFQSVGNQFMLNLAEDIKEHGLLPNQQIVVVYSDELHKYIVYEGNRRIAAIKLLTNPLYFDFLDRPTYIKAVKLSQQSSDLPEKVLCYVTDEKEAFFIMERLHSGEDKGRGLKSWSSREKETFKVRQSDKKSISFLVDYYVRKYCDDFDITTIMPYTTIQRVFGNKRVKNVLGLDVADETTFTKTRVKLIVSLAREIQANAQQEGASISRLYNRAREIEDKVLPLIKDCVTEEELTKLDDSNRKLGAEKKQESKKESDKGEDKNQNANVILSEIAVADGTHNSMQNQSALISNGSQKNLPYFFLGINYANLDPRDVDTHGIAQICNELKYISEKKLVKSLPIAAVCLMRSAIEQSIIYYSKKHCIQGQNKLIWENIKDIRKLSSIIENYKKNLPNYITDGTMRQYFSALFGEYGTSVDTLNWVVHRPAEFQYDELTIVQLPSKGLLALINFLIS